MSSDAQDQQGFADNDDQSDGFGETLGSWNDNNIDNLGALNTLVAEQGPISGTSPQTPGDSTAPESNQAPSQGASMPVVPDTALPSTQSEGTGCSVHHDVLLPMEVEQGADFDEGSHRSGVQELPRIDQAQDYDESMDGVETTITTTIPQDTEICLADPETPGGMEDDIAVANIPENPSNRSLNSGTDSWKGSPAADEAAISMGGEHRLENTFGSAVVTSAQARPSFLDSLRGAKPAFTMRSTLAMPSASVTLSSKASTEQLVPNTDESGGVTKGTEQVADETEEAVGENVHSARESGSNSERKVSEGRAQATQRRTPDTSLNGTTDEEILRTFGEWNDEINRVLRGCKAMKRGPHLLNEVSRNWLTKVVHNAIKNCEEDPVVCRNTVMLMRKSNFSTSLDALQSALREDTVHNDWLARLSDRITALTEKISGLVEEDEGSLTTHRADAPDRNDTNAVQKIVSAFRPNPFSTKVLSSTAHKQNVESGAGQANTVKSTTTPIRPPAAAPIRPSAATPARPQATPARGLTYCPLTSSMTSSTSQHPKYSVPSKKSDAAAVPTNPSNNGSASGKVGLHLEQALRDRDKHLGQAVTKDLSFFGAPNVSVELGRWAREAGERFEAIRTRGNDGSRKSIERQGDWRDNFQYQMYHHGAEDVLRLALDHWKDLTKDAQRDLSRLAGKLSTNHMIIFAEAKAPNASRDTVPRNQLEGVMNPAIVLARKGDTMFGDQNDPDVNSLFLFQGSRYMDAMEARIAKWVGEMVKNGQSLSNEIRFQHLVEAFKFIPNELLVTLQEGLNEIVSYRQDFSDKETRLRTELMMMLVKVKRLANGNIDEEDREDDYEGPLDDEGFESEEPEESEESEEE